MFSEGFLGDLHKPGEEPQMYPELLEEHKKFICDKVYTCFPPEPNGFCTLVTLRPLWLILGTLNSTRVIVT